MSIREIFKLGDATLIIVIFAIALIWSRCNRERNTEPESLRIVTANTDDTLSLFRDTLIAMEHLTIEIKNESAAITHSDCPTQQCVRTGSITTPGQMSACMPNGIWIEILGSEKTTDVISY
ncbi:MAG: NusG domain II-containing protein [Candidatus Sabulitectum sp.]|nr:NusG domain II-containing protein [Candidatus Sabulitectum sp.]